MGGNDAIRIVQELIEVKSKSDTLGRLLKVPRVVVNSIHQEYSDPQDRLLHIVDELLQQIDPLPTWKTIISALKHPLLNCHQLAQDIESKYSGAYIIVKLLFHIIMPISYISLKR